MVCVGHGISLFISTLRGGTFPLPQNVGVLIFFVLSGFVITHTLLERSKDPNYGFGQFFIDRFARIYSGLIPCLIFVAGLDYLTVHLVGPGTIFNSRSPSIFLANILMMESYHGFFDFIYNLEWPIFGSAQPLWTLAVEWHIYIFVGALFFICVRPSSALILLPIAVMCSTVPAHYLFGALQPDGVGLCLFLFWLGGAYTYAAACKFRRLPPLFGFALAGISALIYLFYVKAFQEYRPETCPLLLIFIFGIATATQASKVIKSPALIRAIRFFAGYSFSLYLIHHTIMYSAFLLWPDGGWIVFLPMVILANVIAALLAIPTEMKHKRLAELLTRTFKAH
jgi:peptidoglycan/LPS O-acetylase OafA/YrhL